VERRQPVEIISESTMKKLRQSPNWVISVVLAMLDETESDYKNLLEELAEEKESEIVEELFQRIDFLVERSATLKLLLTRIAEKIKK
jgi:hypothetical protein